MGRRSAPTTISKRCGAATCPSRKRRRRCCNRPGPMRLYIVAVGRLRRGPPHELQALYAERILPAPTIIDVEEKRRLPPAELNTREAELHLRARPLGEHRSIGVVEVEYAGPRLAPHQEVSFEMAGRDLRAYVTGIRARPDRLPHVYVDEVRADAVLEAELAV